MFYDILQSEMRGDGSFGPATPVVELNDTNFVTGYAVVRRDGLEVFFGSARGGASGFWTAIRASTALPWSPPVFVPELGNPAQMQGCIALSSDGRELYFTSTRGGGYGMADLWVARRDKVRGPIR